MGASVSPYVQQVRNRRRAWEMSDYWKLAADEDAAQLIEMIGPAAYREWVQTKSGITENSTWYEISDKITDRIFEIKSGEKV